MSFPTSIAALPVNRAPEPELRRSVLALATSVAYAALGCGRRRRLGKPLMALVLRLEGGPMHSSTARALLERHHEVAVGAYSYGDLFTPGLVPPGVMIGRYCSFGPGVRMFPRNHPLDLPSTHPTFYDPAFGVVSESKVSRGSLSIGHDVWVGANAIITPGCRSIGTGAVIGAGSVVTRDVAPYAIVAGNPARVIRHRFDPGSIDRLLESRWWEHTPREAHARAHRALTGRVSP